MAELKFDEAVARFERNEDRINSFVNGDEATTYFTDTGVPIPSVSNFLSNIGPGAPGLSAYQVWLNQGNVGTEEDFITSLRGPQGQSGFSLSYETRAEAIAKLSEVVQNPNGTIFAAEGLLYEVKRGETAIAAMQGVAPFGSLSAGHFGFSVASTDENVNRDAIRAAVAYAGKQRVYIDAPSDYRCSRLEFYGDVNLEVRGPGLMDRSMGGRALQVIGSYDNATNVTSITNTTAIINGNTERVTRVAVPNAVDWAVGDRAQIVSDDLDPAARTGYTARRGEFFEAIYVDATGVYLAQSLEDQDFYITNVRLVRVRKFLVNIKMGIKSSRDSDSPLILVQSHYKPKMDMYVPNHGGIVSQFSGCVFPRVAVSGASKADALGSLGYLVTFNSSLGGVLEGGYGSMARHISTTGFISVEANSLEYFKYGAPRDNESEDYTSESAQNVPFDDHEGARRTKWTRCHARNAVKGTNQFMGAFQLRGRDSVITNCTADASFDGFVNLSSDGQGHHTVIGCYMQCDLVVSDADGLSRPTVEFVGCTAVVLGSTSSLAFGHGGTIILTGGKYTLKGAVGSARLFNVDGGGRRVILNKPLFELTGTMSSLRLFSFTGTGGLVQGHMLVSDKRTAGNWNSFARSTSVTGAKLDIRVDWLDGSRMGTFLTTADSGTYDLGQYYLKDYSKTPVDFRSSGNTEWDVYPLYPGPFASDSAAASGGVLVSQIYRTTGGTLAWRQV